VRVVVAAGELHHEPTRIERQHPDHGEHPAPRRHDYAATREPGRELVDPDGGQHDQREIDRREGVAIEGHGRSPRKPEEEVTEYRRFAVDLGEDQHEEDAEQQLQPAPAW
jgi:hypothetical protein